MAQVLPRSHLSAGAVDAALARRLLGEALSRGGDYADLYFEYRAAADFFFEEERVRSVGRGITRGLGVRVQRGDATRYAYCAVNVLHGDPFSSVNLSSGAFITSRASMTITPDGDGVGDMAFINFNLADPALSGPG